MVNDKPTSLRMSFGFAQAQAAGLPYQTPPTPSQMDWHLKESAAERELQKLTKSDPVIREELATVVRTDEAAAKLSIQDLLFFAKCLKSHHSKTGFVVTGTDGKVFESDKMERIDLDAISIVLKGRPFTIWRHYIGSILPR